MLTSKLLETRIGIKARKSLISGQVRLLTLELLALEWRKFYTFELEYLWGQLANLDQILCVLSLGLGKGCIIFWCRLDQNSGVHGNRKPPLTYNGENGVSTFFQLFLILILAGDVDMHKISDEFEFRPDRTTDYGVSCPWTSKQISHRLIMGKCCLHASSFIFDRIIIKVAGNQDWHKSSVEFEFGPNQTTHFGVTCPWVTKISHFWTWISLKPVGQSWSNFMCSIIRVGERLHKVDLGTLDSGERLVPFGLLVFISFCILTVGRFIKYNQVLIFPKDTILANYKKILRSVI